MTNEERHFLLDLMSESLDKLKEDQDPLFICHTMFSKICQLIDKDIDNEYISNLSRCESTTKVSEPVL